MSEIDPPKRFPTGEDTRMTRKRTLQALVVVAAITLAVATVALAAFEDGEYSLTLPGAGVFEFTVDSEGEETVLAVAAPDGYAVDDDDPDKAGWKNDAGLEVEAKTDKVEADVNWESGDVILALPDGGSISVSAPDSEGAFLVTTTGTWFAFGDGRDWYVANNSDINAADAFFKVEADEDGVEVKPVDAVDAGFLNDLEGDEDEEAVEEEEEEEEEEEQEEEVEEDDDGEG
jgi:hypothetical protein